MGLKRKRFLISCLFYVLDAAYRIALQAFDISRSELTPLKRFPGNVLCSFSVGVQLWLLVRHFFELSEQEN